MKITKREKIVLGIFAILCIVSGFTPQKIINDWEYVYLLCILTPLGLYILTDPERIERKSE